MASNTYIEKYPLYNLGISSEEVERTLKNSAQKADVDVLQERINKIKYYGDADIEISPDEWFVFNDEEHTILGGLSEGHENETSIVIPYSVTTIGPEAFFDCSNLTSVIIPNSIVLIPPETFYGCSGLTSINIPDSVRSISMDAFDNCSGLTDVTIGSGLRRLNSDAFDGCVSLTNIVVSNNNKHIVSVDNVVFSKDKTELMLYPQGKKDEQYVIPDSVTKICQKAFAGCPNLKSVKMCDNAIELGDGVFGQCINLESIELSNKITYISNFAFYGCSSLASVTIPNSVTDLGMSAFGGCDSLTDIYYDGTLEEWNAINDGFSGIDDLTKIHTLIAKGTCGDNLTWTLNEDYELVIDGTGEMYDWTFDESDIPWKSKAPWNTYDNNIKTIIINNGVKNIADGAFFDCNYVTSVVMQGGIERIGRYAFAMCYNLEDLTIPNSVTSIADNAFYDCIIKSISIPDSVVSVGNEIFNNCRKLTDVNIGKGITAISEGMFVVCKSLEKISIPDGVTSIENRAFYNCTSLKIIIMPDSVTNIADDAFGNCNNLTIYCSQGSYADTYAKENNIPVKYTDIYIDKTVTAYSENAVSGGAVFEAVGEAVSIAKGRATGYVFDTLAGLDAWLEDIDNMHRLVIGDNLYIRAIDVPDYWWDGEQKQQLETQKVDLSEYYTKTEISAKIDEVSDIADEAKEIAENAIEIADDAVFKSENAEYTSRQAEANARTALNSSKEALNTALNSKTLADNAIEIAQSVRTDADNGVFNGQDGADYIITEADKEEIKSDVVETLTRSSTALPEMLDVNTIYDLGEQDALTLNLPAGKLGDFIEVDFLSTQTPTTLTITASTGMSDYNLIPDANTIYSLYFNWIRLDVENYGWGFGYAEYTRTVTE